MTLAQTETSKFNGHGGLLSRMPRPSRETIDRLAKPPKEALAKLARSPSMT